MSGQQAWEQPGAGGGCADAEVATPVADQCAQQPGERFGDMHVVAAQAQEHLLAAVGDLVDGDRGDPGGMT